MEQKRCISSLTLAELSAELKALGQPGFRAKQIFHWVHQKLVTEFSAMTDQPKTLLAKLEETFYIAAPQIERRQEAKDGTVKYLLRMADGNCIETVVMRYHYGNKKILMQLYNICSQINRNNRISYTIKFLCSNIIWKSCSR